MQESARNLLKCWRSRLNVAIILTTNRRAPSLPRYCPGGCLHLRRSIASQHGNHRFRDVPGKALRSMPICRFLRFLPADLRRGFGLLNGPSRALDGTRPFRLEESLVDCTSLDSDSGAPASILAILNRCKPSIVWTLFLSRIARYMRDALRNDSADAREISCFSRWTVLLRDAYDSVNVYNIGAQAAIEKLREEMKAAL